MNPQTNSFNSARKSLTSKSILIRSVLSATLTLAGSAMLMVGTTGCGDTLTYATDARKTGLAHYQQAEYTEAAGSFRNAIRQDPRDYRSFYYLGQSYDAIHAYQQAINAYRSCLDVMPLTLEGFKAKEFRLHALDALATSIGKSSSHGIETATLEKQCSETPNVEGFFLLAKVYKYTGDADAALNAYNHAVLLDPKNFAVTKEAGLYQVKMGQNERAAFSLKKAYAIRPDDVQVASALRQIGVVPGPSLKEPGDMAQPGMPKGPIPEWDLTRNNKTQPAPVNGSIQQNPSAGDISTANIQQPRD